MASIGYEGERGELKRIMFRDVAGKQKSLRLGKCSERNALLALSAMDHLLEAKQHDAAPHYDAVRWLERIDDRIHARVVALGLAQPRDTGIVTLGRVLAAFFDGVDVKPASLVRMKQAQAALVNHFADARDVATIGEADADLWRAGLTKAGYAPATISRTVLYARQVFRWAIRRGMVKGAGGNPLAQLKAGPQTNAARAVFVSREMIAKVIDAAPDAQWRLLIALSRFGGLRVPSEALALRWSDVDREHQGHRGGALPASDRRRLGPRHGSAGSVRTSGNKSGNRGAPKRRQARPSKNQKPRFRRGYGGGWCCV